MSKKISKRNSLEHAKRVSNELFDIVKKYSQDKSGCIIEQYENDRSLFSITRTRDEAFDDLLKSVKVICFFEKYWLNISIKFDVKTISTKQEDYLLNSIYIKAFEENNETSAKDLIFRAEWSEFVKDSNHAQPHWHIYPKIINHICKDSNNFGEFINLTLESSELLDEPITNAKDSNMKRFHFAMASNWHINVDQHTIKFDFDMIKKWLEGCLKYMKNELK